MVFCSFLCNIKSRNCYECTCSKGGRAGIAKEGEESKGMRMNEWVRISDWARPGHTCIDEKTH